MYAFVEVDEADTDTPFSNQRNISSVAWGPFDFCRSGYEPFDALAGGRELQMAPEERDPTRMPLIAPRGMPSPRSMAVARDYFYVVAAPSDLPNHWFWPHHRCVTPDVAEEWLRSKGSEESTVIQWFNIPRQGRKKGAPSPPELTWRVVSALDLHTASWLRLDEFDAALRHRNLNFSELPVAYAIVRNAMSLVAERRGMDRVRLVIWFD